MKKYVYIVVLAVLALAFLTPIVARGSFWATNVSAVDAEESAELSSMPVDTVVQPRFPIRTTTAQSVGDDVPATGDLKNPENLKTGVFYDDKTGQYFMGTKLGDDFLETPFFMSADDYSRWAMQRSIRAYYKEKNAEEYSAQGKEKFDFTDMQFDLGPASKIFGPGGVRIKTQGSAELKFGANMRYTDNPSLAERNRRVFGFDFDEKINLSVNGKVGDKVNLDFNYNSEATFNFDTQNLKLRYEGKEDEIIKLIEAGNVSFPSNSSLVRGASSLFGVRADMQFGKLKLQTVVSQKKSSTTSTSSKGGVQLSTFEISAANYDENRHFFLAHFFRDNYDQNMSQLPNILSGITINRVEIWVTNKTGVTTNTRNIVALTDLGEHDSISNSLVSRGSTINPANASNSLYALISTNYSTARDISQTATVLDGAGFEGGTDYEKLESARLLSSSEYNLNTALGYVSLKSTLQTDQVLAVAYEYTYRGQTYQVGEFSSDIKDNSSALIVKALRNTACTPQMGNWHLMMKNVYSLGATSVQKDKFRLDVKILSDTTGVYLSYLPVETYKNTKLLRLLGLDRLDNNNKTNPNGYFDYVEGYTVDATNGRIYFPVVQPFGSHLRKTIGDELFESYGFQALYDSTKTIAKQIAEQDKYVLTGQYKASKTNEIQLSSTNIPQGSVVVTAGGVTLTEGTDYKVDYSSGIVTILNQSILDAGTSINVSTESDSEYGMQRKTMLGLNWQYDFSKAFSIGGTLMHLSESALTSKVSMGSEPLNNTIWGLNMSWKKESQWLTNALDRLPFVHATAPSSINFTAEFAQLIARNGSGGQSNASYIDDFENSDSEIDISNPKEWMISSTPSQFPESNYSNDVRYGYNRALMAWYYIDPIFTRRSSSLTPGHIKSDLKQLSDPDVMDVYKNHLFPNKTINYQESSTLSVLNVAFYPNERGPYNLDTNIDANGHLLNPTSRWGGMMRKLDTSDFETANVEYIEFWLMDPYIKAREEGTTFSGDLYFNLGEISEDVLKDGKKFFESGLPIDDDASQYTTTVWGRVPSTTSVTYAFNTSSGSRAKQDVGFNGLTSAQESEFPAYRSFLESIRSTVRSEVYDSIAANPSADAYHYYRGSDFDAAQTSILDRYKRINMPNGNSVDTDNSPEKYATAYKTTPDVEDINQDYTLNEYEKYYQYHVSISPEQMNVGQNFIVDKRETSVKTRDGNSRNMVWYLFRIPVSEYEKKVGNISDFSSVRFMRMFLTGFEKPVVLRFCTLNLVRGEWRAYEQALYTGKAPDATGTLAVSSVNFEENNEKEPVNYVLPPGVSRAIEPGQSQILQNNEQALSLTVENLGSGDARAVYKSTSLDLRRYKHIQMFGHANRIAGGENIEDGQVSLFIRMGSDYRSNFYEYEIPLSITADGQYANSGAGPIAVWPEENMLDIDLSLLTDVKRNRNRQKSLGLASYATLYSEYDPDKPANKVSVMGNPTLGEVRTIMIGVRNNSRATKSVEVWANELRLQNFSNNGGWAAQSQLNVQLSDIGSIALSGHVETEGFGGLEESVSSRRDDNLYQYSVTTNVDVGRFVPEQVKLKAPLYYSYSKERTVPKYNPLDTDMLLDEALDAASTKAERDSIKNIAETVVVSKNLSLSGVRFNIATPRHPMPYDPANFTFSYAYSSRNTTGETTAWEKDQNWKWSLGYAYSPVYKAFEPFKKLKSKSKWLKIIKELNFNYLPQSVSFNSDITRSYYEFQERDMENLGENTLPLTFSSDFLWNRTFSLRWDLTKSLHMNFSSGTNAEIEQPYTPVNKHLYPTQYEAWKDSVRTSIFHMGTPLSYQQNFDASWTLPLNKLPLFDWLTSDVKYASTYAWERGTELESGSTLGHTITNSRTVTGNVRLKMETLYNHVPFLKKANKRFASSSGRTAKGVERSKSSDSKKPFEREITLKADTTTTLRHNLRTKKLRVTAIRPDGTRYSLRYRATDNNNILILSQDTARIKVTVAARSLPETQGWYKTLQVVARGLMSVRSVSIAYTNKNNMTLPGFLPQIGDMFGQARGGGMFQPGLDFAFGFTGDDYINKAAERGWLLQNDSITTPATTARNEDLQIRATLEPVRDLKIDLTASRTVNRTRSIQFMYEGMPKTQTGSYSMTTISIGSAFEGMGNADNGYSSKRFEKFVSSLEAYRSRVEAQYEGAVYPAGTELAGKTFDPANGTVDAYSSEVMIPAFLNAYTSSGSGLEIFPALKRLLPNWSLTYSGLSKLKIFKDVFKSVTINHSYKSIYSVGSYSSFTSYQEYMNGLGFINDVTTGLPVPSCPFDISTVSINESFSPLIGINVTMKNNVTAKLEMRRTRVLTLSMTSQQLTETRSNDFVIGAGYKIQGLNLFAPKTTVKKGNQKSRSGQPSENASGSSTKKGADSGFSNDLNLRLDISLRNQSAINRDIATVLSQATSGNKAVQISFSADYALSKYLTLTAYYDRQMNKPLLTSSSYPTTTQDFGINLKFILNR